MDYFQCAFYHLFDYLDVLKGQLISEDFFFLSASDTNDNELFNKNALISWIETLLG